ncbi:uncharacterized protein LOC125242690 isoform X2 [Leguminivora glycinivorella]|uniref:uncharacterized protein LOC125242690 isoform X2 n=1 Tax=Leguminivora glycinivorella TaxID=1035111 RepID=UPI00200E6E72|nr:uncharacterized protein LOC125242690 isoform X2 [Leguminivora glycinivorella]
MGNRALRRKKKSLRARKKINQENSQQRKKKIIEEKKRITHASAQLRRPKSLVSLCKRVIAKYKLQKEPKKLTSPESFSVVGGKPLRALKKRTEKPPEIIPKKKKGRSPKSLAELCQIVIEEYNLLPQCEETEQPAPNQLLIETASSSSKKRGRPPGKKPENVKEKKQATRKRGRPRKDQKTSSEFEEPSISYSGYSSFLEQSQDIRRSPKSLAELCQIVIKEYNLLPQCEETEQPAPNQLLIETASSSSKKRGRPPGKKPENVKEKKQATRKRGRPRKDQKTSSEFEEPSISYSGYTSFLEQSQDIRKIKIEQDLFLDQPPEDDPLQDEDDFTIEIKEERVDIEIEQECVAISNITEASAQEIVLNPMVQVGIPDPYGQVTVPNTMTVVMDEYQIFANSIAEQLRTLPPNRALLLQLDIQTMIDNEKQLIGHES